MVRRAKHNGAVFLMVVFAIALIATITVGILVMTTEELKLMQNHLYAAEALATAEAGLNDAFAEIRTDSSWTDGFTDKSFNDGSYDVSVSGTLPNRTVIATGTSAQGYVAEVNAVVTIGGSDPNNIIRIDNLRINE